MVRARAGVAAKKLSSFLANSAELHVLVLLVDVLVLGSVDLAVRTRPLALGGLVQLGIETAKMVSPRTGVAKNDLATLLTDLAVFLKPKMLSFREMFSYQQPLLSSLKATDPCYKFCWVT